MLNPVQMKLKPEVMKELQVLLYIAGKIPYPFTTHIMNILYRADKIYLKKIGQTITNERYLAMNNGPFASRMHKLTCSVRNPEPLGNPNLAEAFRNNGISITPLHKADMTYINQYEKECLDTSIAALGSLGFNAIKREGRDSAYQAAIDRDNWDKEIKIADILASP